MEKMEIPVRFLTPAFLGDAEQKGAWRSPPFKALLRQWWRVAVAKSFNYNFGEIREEEGLLFGHADSSSASQSQVRIRLAQWGKGTLTSWAQDPRVTHNEVKMPVGAHLYLGYGPLIHSKESKKTALKCTPAIAENEKNRMLLTFPSEAKESGLTTLQLIHWFGTLGGRSRNGWGSIALEHEDIFPFDSLLKGEKNNDFEKYSRSLNDCLALEWPHALGRDQKGILLWKTKTSFPTWSDAIKALAEAKIAFRTALKFTGPGGPFATRHLLSYPVTKHHVVKWGNQARLANQLRFKVVQQADQNYIGLAFHLPCGLPKELLQKLEKSDQARLTPAYQGQIWKQVHDVLDQQMTRIQGGR